MNLVEITVHATGAQAKAAIDEVKGKLDDLGKRVADARIRLSGNVEAQAQLARINARMIELNNRIADPKIKIEGIARAQAELLALLAAMNKLDNTSTKRFSFGQGSGGFFGAIQKGLAAILNMGPSAVPILAAIGVAVLEIVQYFGAMISAIAAAGIGVGAFAVFAVPTFMKIVAGVQAVSKAANDVAKDKAWAAIPAALRPAVQMGLQAKGVFDQMVAAMRPQVVRIFGDALKVVKDLLPQLMPIAKTAGQAIDGLLKGFDGFVKSAGFKSFMAQMQQLSGPAITAIGQGLGRVIIQLGNFLQVAASPQGIVALKGAFWLLAGAIKLVTLGMRGTQNGAQAMLDGFLSLAGVVLGVAKAITDAFLTAVGTIARLAARIPGPWQNSMKAIAASIDGAKKKADNFFADSQARLAFFKNRVDSTQLVFRLQGNITDLQNKLATANRALRNPNLTATKRARIEANISQAMSQIAAIRFALNALQGNVYTTYVQTVPIGGGAYLTHREAGGITGAAAGGIRSGLTMVGEHGRELISGLPPGAMVHSNPDTERIMSQAGGPQRVVLEIRSGGSQLDEALLLILRSAVRVRGGNVQLVLRTR